MKTIVLLLVFVALISCAFADKSTVLSHLDVIKQRLELDLKKNALHGSLEKCLQDTKAFEGELIQQRDICLGVAKKIENIKALIAQTKAQIASLEKALAAAKEASKKEADKKRADIDKMLKAIDTLLKVVADLEKKHPEKARTYEKMNLLLKQMRERLLAQKAAISNFGPAVTDLETLLRAAQAKLENYEKLLSHLLTSHASCLDKIDPLRLKITLQSKECDGIRDKLHALLDRIRGEIKDVEKVYDMVNNLQDNLGGGGSGKEDSWTQIKKEVEHIIGSVLREKEEADKKYDSELDAINSKCQSDSAALKKKIADIKAKIAQAEADVKFNEDRIRLTRIDIRHLNETIAMGMGELNQTRHQCLILGQGKDHDAGLGVEIAAIKEVIDFTHSLARKKEITPETETKLVTKFTTILKELEKQLADRLAKQLEAFKLCITKQKSLELKLEDLRVKRAGKESELFNYLNKILEIQGQLALLQKELADAINSLIALAKNCAALREQLKTTRKDFSKTFRDLDLILSFIESVIKKKQQEAAPKA